MNAADDLTIQELADQDPRAQEIARYANDPDALMRLLEDLVRNPPEPTFPTDESATLRKLGGMEPGDWPIVLVSCRFAPALNAYYGQAAMKLRVSEVRQWLTIRLDIHRRCPTERAFLEHLRNLAPEAVNAKEVAVMMAGNISAYYGKAAASVSWNEISSYVRLVV